MAVHSPSQYHTCWRAAPDAIPPFGVRAPDAPHELVNLVMSGIATQPDEQPVSRRETRRLAASV